MGSEWDKTITTPDGRIETRFYYQFTGHRKDLFKVIYVTNRKTGHTEVVYDQRGNLQKEYKTESDLEKGLKLKPPKSDW